MAKKLEEVEWIKDHTGSTLPNAENRVKMRDLLNETGPGFCLAKWTQVTMHLGNGLTHSCHHPHAHKIPLDELKDNPSALHNTIFKKQRRKEMITIGMELAKENTLEKRAKELSELLISKISVV